MLRFVHVLELTLTSYACATMNRIESRVDMKNRSESSAM